MKTWTLCLLEENPAEGTAYYDLDSRYPEAACHDGVNKLFIGTSDLQAEGTYIQLEDYFTEEMDRDAKAWVLSKIMVIPNRPPIRANWQVFDTAFKHEAYKLYIGKYEDEALFQKHLAYLRGMITNSIEAAKDAEDTTAHAKWKRALTAFDNQTAGMTSDQVSGVMVDLIRAFGV